MLKIRFPKVAGKLNKELLEKYYKVYYTYVLNLFKHVGAEVEFVEDSAVSDGTFAMWVNNKKILIDYSDYTSISSGYKDPDMVAYFKFHYSDGIHTKYPKMYPFPPVSFYDWKEYSKLQKEILYNAGGDNIINRQKPYGNARYRRAGVQAEMKKVFGKHFHMKQIDQATFWKDINDCLMAVFVPGCRNNMLDRGHIQYMGFGCCVVSPTIINVLPFWKMLQPGVDYIACRDDYLDLMEKCKWAKEHRHILFKIGKRAKQLFLETSTPKKVVRWVLEVVKGEHCRD